MENNLRVKVFHVERKLIVREGNPAREGKGRLLKYDRVGIP